MRILTYSPALEDSLRRGVDLPNGSPEEVALRAGSVLAVERVREAIERRMANEAGGDLRHQGQANGDIRHQDEANGKETKTNGGTKTSELAVSSVLIDFYLWDLAKRVESGAERIEGIETAEVLPAHRTRSIWY